LVDIFVLAFVVLKVDRVVFTSLVVVAQSAAPHLSLVARSQSRGNPLVFCLSLGFPRV